MVNNSESLIQINVNKIKDGMKKVFESGEHERVGFFQSILESHEIRTLIKNDSIAASEGTSSLDLVLPELWVVDDLDYPRAIDILTPYY